MLDRRVALKFLHERFAQDEQFVERFRREASAAAGLQHPNVVGVFDRGTYDGSHYIAMEYVEGASLNDLIERGLSVPEAVEIVRQVLAGARYAHAHGIVHRDLKPQNVLVDAEGRARVTDFGIARAGASEITQTGSVLGTAQYLSPEQAQGLPVTAASDIYSIGVLLYEALTGRVPFEAESPVTVALKQVSERPRPPSELNPAVSRALDAVVLKALAKDPANRFASADEFLAALDAAEADPSGASLGDTASYAAVAAAARGASRVASAGREPSGAPGLLHPREADRPGAAPLAGRRRARLRAHPPRVGAGSDRDRKDAGERRGDASGRRVRGRGQVGAQRRQARHRPGAGSDGRVTRRQGLHGDDHGVHRAGDGPGAGRRGEARETGAEDAQGCRAAAKGTAALVRHREEGPRDRHRPGGRCRARARQADHPARVDRSQAGPGAAGDRLTSRTPRTPRSATRA